MTTLAARVTEVRDWLTAQHMLAEDEWLNGCVEYLCADGTEYKQTEINSLAREQWLLNDLKDICPGSLPAGLLHKDKTQLEGRYVLQVNCAFDIGTPAYQQYQKLNKVNVENIEETRHEERIPNHRMIKLYLTDGVQEIFGMEYRTMRNLTCDITPGCKLLLKGPVECRRGMLMLHEHNVEILGGEVEDLVTANSLSAVLSRMLGVENVRTQNNTVLPPSAVPVNSDCTLTTQDSTTRNAQLPTNFQRSQFNNSDRAPNLDRPNADIQTLQSNNLSRPVAVVTGVPIADSFCDDDIDLEQIAAIEEQVTKTNKRPLLSDCRSERRSSAEKKLKMLNENRLDEFPCDEDLIQDADYFNTELLNLNNANSKLSYPIEVRGEPFVYIKQMNEMEDETKEGKSFRIKGQIVKLLSKLSIGKEGWSLKCTLIDGSGLLDVDFTSDVLTKLVGYSPSEMNRMKKQMTTDPEIKNKAMAALNAARVKLQELNCIIEISFIEGPKITELNSFTQMHAELLKNRLSSTNL